ncbi:MAG: extracellular solute-binding protein [Planctomycetota bacterium]
MRERVRQWLVLGLMLAVVAVPFALRGEGAGGSGEAIRAGRAETLVVYTPHNEQIRFEMAAGFNRWRASRGETPVRFDWRAGGGTTDLRRTVLAQFEAKANRGEEDRGIGADLFFGGGTYDHDKLAGGVRVTEGDGTERRVAVAVAADLPAGLVDRAFPQRSLGAEPLVHPERLWVGTALSSFGIVYNRDLLAMLGRDPPQTWSDLADPGYEGWLALADPGHSGSIAATLNTVLRRSGWEAGWGTLRRVFANARYFSSSASKVPVDVSAGEAAAGMCIDFYGRTQAGAVAAAGWSGDPAGAARTSRVGYADPVVGGRSMTATTADPVTLLRGAPRPELATRFIEWLLSAEAQRLWQRRVGVAGGPVRHALRRMPIRVDLYTPQEKWWWTDPEVDPFASAAPVAAGMPDFFNAVAPLTKAMAVDVHGDLVAAWETLRRTPEDHPAKAEMRRRFEAMPPGLTPAWPDVALAEQWPAVLADPGHPRHDEAAGVLKAVAERFHRGSRDQRLRDRLAWTAFFRDNYREIVRLGWR